MAARYVDAFERYDMEALTALLHDDAVMSMPPYDLWLQGAEQVVAWNLGPGHECRGSRLVPVRRQRLAGVGSVPPPGRRQRTSRGRWSCSRPRDGKVTGINSFLDTERLFPLFGLPATLD